MNQYRGRPSRVCGAWAVCGSQRCRQTADLHLSVRVIGLASRGQSATADTCLFCLFVDSLNDKVVLTISPRSRCGVLIGLNTGRFVIVRPRSTLYAATAACDSRKWSKIWLFALHGRLNKPIRPKFGTKSRSWVYSSKPKRRWSVKGVVHTYTVIPKNTHLFHMTVCSTNIDRFL